jgi:DNA-binding response OmpR family regulator
MTHLALIIEDEDDLSAIFSEALQVAGFTTEAIKRGDTAMARLTEVVPEVVVLDLHLPGVDGKDLMKHIREDARLAHTQIVVASADAALAQALEVNADLTLLKPISFSQLRDLAKRLLPATAEGE